MENTPEHSKCGHIEFKNAIHFVNTIRLFVFNEFDYSTGIVEYSSNLRLKSSILMVFEFGLLR